MFDPFSIALMVGGAALQHQANNAALKKQQAEAVRMQQRQLQQRNMATDAAMRRVEEFDPGTRQKAHDALQQELTQGFEQQAAQPQITAQGVQVGSTIPEGQGGAEFLTARAREQQKAQASLRALAALMGRTGAATELRRNEAVGFGDTAGEIGRIQNHAGNIAGIDEIGIQAAGQVNPVAQIAGAAMSALGSGRMAGAGLKPAMKFPEFGAPSGPTGGWV